MVFNSTKIRQNAADLRRLLRRFDRYEFGAKAAEEFGRIRTELRRIGRPIPSIDVQIAAIARLHNLTLLTADAHFADVQGLKIQNWLAA